MNKLYFKPSSCRDSDVVSRCIYYDSLGTVRHLKVDMRKLYRDMREFDTPEIARQEVMISMLMNPICTIRKATEL